MAITIRRPNEESQRRGWSVVRWITAEDNYRARAMYDGVATKTAWATYDMHPTQ